MIESYGRAYARTPKKVIFHMKFEVQKGASSVRPEGQAFGGEWPGQWLQAGKSKAC